jgi:hypothetical protein
MKKITPIVVAPIRSKPCFNVTSIKNQRRQVADAGPITRSSVIFGSPDNFLTTIEKLQVIATGLRATALVKRDLQSLRTGERYLVPHISVVRIRMLGLKHAGLGGRFTWSKSLVFVKQLQPSDAQAQTLPSLLLSVRDSASSLTR